LVSESTIGRLYDVVNRNTSKPLFNGYGNREKYDLKSPETQEVVGFRFEHFAQKHKEDQL
jgi:hypothetical protein